MDNVSGIEFYYQIIRRPKTQSNNIFEYAASLSIVNRKKVFLQVEDICIVDFIYQLSLYNSNTDIFEFVPIDSTDKVLIINALDSQNVKIESEWTDKTMIVKKEVLIDSIKLLKTCFENETNVKIERYYK